MNEFDKDLFFKFFKRIPGKHYEHKTDRFGKGERSQRKFPTEMLEKLVPIPYDMLVPIAQVYNMVWRDKYLLCPKYEYMPVGVRSKSLLDGSRQYSISYHFVEKEYRRTNSPMLRGYMKSALVFGDVLDEVDKEKRNNVEKLVYRDKYIKGRVYGFGEEPDETSNYL